MERCMVDIETLGLEPGCIVLSIGAVYFDKDGLYNEFYRNIDMESCDDIGLEVEVSTLQWWLEQEKEAQECLIGGVPIEEALYDLKDFCEDVQEVWANSPSMDCSVLEAAYEAVDMNEPWEYHEERCFRTLENMSGGRLPEQEGVAHNALDDAKHQARVASVILQDLHRE